MLYKQSQNPESNFTELKKKIDELYPQVLQLSTHLQATTFLQQATVNCNLKNCTFDLEKLGENSGTFFGAINQYDLSQTGSSSACTNCAQYFLTRILFFNRPEVFQSSELIDECVVEGKKNYDLWMHQQKIASKLAGTPVRQNLGHDETKDIYSLENIKLAKSVFDLRPDGEKTTKGCFTYALILLEQILLENKIPIGVVIHAQNKTYGLALFIQNNRLFYVFFDSHGKNQGKAYVTFTMDQNEMAGIMAELVPVQTCEIDDISDEVKKMLEADLDNEFALNVVKLNMLPPTQEIQSPITVEVIEENKTNPTDEKSNLPELDKGSAAIYWIATSILMAVVAMVAYSVGLAQRITSYTSRKIDL